MADIHPTRMFIGAGFGYLAFLINVIAFAWYVIVVFQAEVTTNPITWWLWLLETGIGLAIYADRTRDLPKYFTEVASLVGAVLVSGYLCREVLEGRAEVVLQTVERVDWLIAILTIVVFGYWIKNRNWLEGRNRSIYLFQVVLLLAAFPLIRSTIAHPAAEPFWPWAIWTVAFICQTVAAWLRWDGPEPLYSPINYALTHGIVAGTVLWGAAS